MDHPAANQYLPEAPAFYSVAKTALTLDLAPRTILRFIASGRLKAVRTSALKGRYRIPRAALVEFLQEARA